MLLCAYRFRQRPAFCRVIPSSLPIASLVIPLPASRMMRERSASRTDTDRDFDSLLRCATSSSDNVISTAARIEVPSNRKNSYVILFVARYTRRTGQGIAEYVQWGFEDYLKCVRLEHGILRLRSDICQVEHLMASSCKYRGLLRSFCSPPCKAALEPGACCLQFGCRRLFACRTQVGKWVCLTDAQKPTIRRKLRLCKHDRYLLVWYQGYAGK